MLLVRRQNNAQSMSGNPELMYLVLFDRHNEEYAHMIATVEYTIIYYVTRTISIRQAYQIAIP